MSIFPSKVTYTTGQVLTATEMNEIGQAINLLDGAQLSGAKNRVLNSQMNVWQRGTSITTATAVYTADRWQAGIASAGTVSRQVTNDTTNLPFIQYCLRYQRTAASSSTSDLALSQSFETVNSIPLVGKTVAFSFYARKGSNFSATSDLLTARVVTGTGTDQNLYSGYTGQATALQVNATLTTTWQRFSGTVAIGTTVTEMGVQFFAAPTGTAGANDYYEITGVQLEAANTVSPYAPNGATYQAELAACQRYYQKSYNQTVAVPTNSSFGGVIAGPSTSTVLNQAYGYIKFPVVMRTAPTVTTYSYTSSTTSVISNAAGTDQAAGSGVASGIGDGGFGLYNSAATVTTTNGWLIHFQASSEL